MSVLDTLKATHKLRDSGLDEATASAIVEVVKEATDDLVTKEYFDTHLRAELNGALLRFGLAFGFGMFGIMLGVAAASLAVAQWMFG